ncbi:MAG: hypothetical protein M3X11_22640, partial [Acidobacteriota bacterium]|nr:hypothetical protein [Acidobacteriota bacterium]
MNRKILSLLFLLMLAALSGLAQDVAKAIPAGSKVFINTMPDGFETHLVEALKAKKVPVEVVTEKDKADFEITGTSESKKAGAAKILITGSWRSREQASIVMTNVKSGVAVWGYNVNKSNSYKGKQSSS